MDAEISVGEVFEIRVEEGGERVDSYLAGVRPELSRARVQKLIEAGLVTLGGKPVRPSRKVAAGQLLRVAVPPPEPDRALPEEIPLELLYEDSRLVAVAKPVGLVVHPAPGHRTGTLVNALLHRLPDLSGVGGVVRPGIVHRLDKDTSGVILVAKDDETHRGLQKLFKERVVKKTYLAVAAGKLSGEGVIDAPIGRHPSDRKKFAAGVAGGRTAVTRWKVMEELNGATLLEVVIETGRTHQIRVHLASIGHPLLGDPLYGGNRAAGAAKAREVGAAVKTLGGQALHAWKLEFPHPATGQSLNLVAPIPENLAALLTCLGRKPR